MVDDGLLDYTLHVFYASGYATLLVRYTYGHGTLHVRYIPGLGLLSGYGDHTLHVDYGTLHVCYTSGLGLPRGYGDSFMHVDPTLHDLFGLLAFTGGFTLHDELRTR